MPSYEQLESEPWWDREVVTPELDWLGDQICSQSGRSRDAFGTKGDNAHLNGGHRSQEWIQNSVYCTNRSYTVQSGLTSDQVLHIAAGDFTPGAWGTTQNRQLVAQQTTRLWNEATAGRLLGVTQIQGTLDGRTTAGLNVGSGSTFKPDSSHLDHWHLTFDRRFMHDLGLMQRILGAALGTGGGEMYAKYGMGLNGSAISHDTMYLQRQMLYVVQNDEVLVERLPQHPLVVDGKYGDGTAYWVSVIVTGGPGTEVTGNDFAHLEQMVIDYKIEVAGVGEGPAGPKGDKGDTGPEGPKGDKGDAAVLLPGTKLEVTEE